ncbi:MULTISPECIES: hypothetical protein [Acinetobacter]|uniref:Uncharacterized protein n=1 Tax=Acinetobacter silvestris TaxID=1977882 RepID=A0A1Y3CPS1_9GAMM|nr:hypothetical protein [Acinetobacter silvestris]OTG67616.1 hypothetical protein B9T28_03070 [Acinetobacter silvestris]
MNLELKLDEFRLYIKLNEDKPLSLNAVKSGSGWIVVAFIFGNSAVTLLCARGHKRTFKSLDSLNGFLNSKLGIQEFNVVVLDQPS